ncbi:hypothetical protein TcCL_Unassigned01535 [Trypanosoma cruzi]|nr:hypothetical protein TcCL_Unassigned01535 [Trypanosoma cruzi]
MRSALSALLRSTRTVQCVEGSAIRRMRDAPRWQTDSSQATHQPVASSMRLHGLSVLVPSETEGLRRSAATPRCVVSSNKTSEDGRVHHRGNRPQMWETASHPPEKGAHDVPPRQLRSLSGEGKFVKKEVSALTSTPGSFIRTVESSIRGLHTF